jgi:bleomycin hydrolase
MVFRFFIAKNSWGTGNPYGGYMYLSFNYVKLKTIAILEKRKD